MEITHWLHGSTTLLAADMIHLFDFPHGLTDLPFTLLSKVVPVDPADITKLHLNPISMFTDLSGSVSIREQFVGVHQFGLQYTATADVPVDFLFIFTDTGLTGEIGYSGV